MRPLRILTWHIHGNYLYYLVQSQRHEFYLPVKPGHPEGYGGRLPGFSWPTNVHDVPADEVRHLDLDCVLFQSRRNYLFDQFEILSDKQSTLPRIYLEHNPPGDSPTDALHPVSDPNVLIVHVTHYNDLMWNCNGLSTRVIEHGVLLPNEVRYTGDLARGLVVINNLKSRGRALGADIFERVRPHVPLDLIGMDATALNGLGEIGHDVLPEFESHYRFFFSPMRHTSLALALCEAMMIGLPIVGLATSELVTVVENGVSGHLDTNVNNLMLTMHELLAYPALAQRLSAGARRYAQERFNIQRFVHDWDETFELVTQGTSVVMIQADLAAAKG